jgi:hypothetical protein
MLWTVEPVLAQAHAMEMQESTRANIANLRQQASQAGGQAAAINELNRRSQQAANLQSFSTQMAINTTNLMRAMSGK